MVEFRRILGPGSGPDLGHICAPKCTVFARTRNRVFGPPFYIPRKNAFSEVPPKYTFIKRPPPVKCFCISYILFVFIKYHCILIQL